MKRHLIVIFSVLLAGAAYAAPVSEKTAQEFACNYFGAKSVSKAFTAMDLQTKAAVAPEFYAFNNPAGGWVILSADDCATPVLAHSDKGSISLENMPANMCAYIKMVTGNIAKAAAAKVPATTVVRNAWATKGLRTKASESQKLIQTANWDQGSPYNDTICAKIGVNGLYTGCVATSIAIVLQHLKWPVAGKGVIPAYKTSSKKYNVPAVDLDACGNYRWNDMPLGKPTTVAQKSAVAQLMFHCGALVEMDYTTDGSGADTYNLAPMLIKHMSVSAGAHEAYRFDYSDYEWFNMIKAEIDADVPLLYGGIDALSLKEGHQFVIDGYNSDYEVHVNWGWSGSDNGWFAVCYLGSASVGDVFSYSDSGIFGVRPDSSGSDSAFPEVTLYADSPWEGITLTSGEIAKSKSFSVKIGYITNNDYEAEYHGSVKMGLVDRFGNLKEYIGSAVKCNLGNYNSSTYYTAYDSYSCQITRDIVPGDYLALFYSNNAGTQWRQMGGFNIPEDDNYEATWTITRLGAIPGLTYIYVPDVLKVGNVLYFELVSGGMAAQNPVWYFDGQKNTKGYVKLSAGDHTLKVKVSYSDGSSETISRKISVK